MSSSRAPSVRELGPAKAADAPQTFGKYELIERLGRGGMAEVWKAKIRGVAGFERTLVIKRILPHHIADAGFVAMFVREAQICSMLSHANIVQVYELGEIEGEYYLAMEYVHGKDLRTVLRARPKEPGPPGIAAVIGRDVCRALAYAHALPDKDGAPLRLIHRDVSPSNLMLCFDGATKLVDFGVAKALATASPGLSSAGSVKGKFSYMSPEQITGGLVDHRSDLFAVGIVMYETLTSQRLFRGANDEETLEMVLGGSISPPSRANPAVPRELDRVVMRALERIPSRRFQTGDAMADALEACIHDLKSSHAQVAAELRDRFPELEPSASGLRTRGSFPSSEAIEDAHASYTEAVSNSGTQRFRPTLPVVHTIEDMGSWSDGGLDASTSPRASQPAIRAELSSHESAADAPQTRTRSAAIPLALACSFVLLVAALVAFYQHQRVTKPRAVAVSPSAPLTSPKKPAHDPALASRSESKSASASAPASAPTTTKRAPARSRSVAKSRPAPHAAPSRTDVENGELLSPF